jgi:hypothetical protein
MPQYAVHKLAKVGNHKGLSIQHCIGGDFNERDEENKTPLQYAIEGEGKKFELTVIKLIEYGASPLRIDVSKASSPAITEILEKAINKIHKEREDKKQPSPNSDLSHVARHHHVWSGEKECYVDGRGGR